MLSFDAAGKADGGIMRLGKALIGNSAQKVIDGFFEAIGEPWATGVTRGARWRSELAAARILTKRSKSAVFPLAGAGKCTIVSVAQRARSVTRQPPLPRANRETIHDQFQTAPCRSGRWRCRDVALLAGAAFADPAVIYDLRRQVRQILQRSRLQRRRAVEEGNRRHLPRSRDPGRSPARAGGAQVRLRPATRRS